MARNLFSRLARAEQSGRIPDHSGPIVCKLMGDHGTPESARAIAKAEADVSNIGGHLIVLCAPAQTNRFVGAQ